jgi:hypothetical protein
MSKTEKAIKARIAEQEQIKARDWQEERLAIMMFDGEVSEFQARQYCMAVLEKRRTRQKELFV